MRQHLRYDEMFDHCRKNGMYVELLVDTDPVTGRDHRDITGLRVRRTEGQAGMRRKTIVAERDCTLEQLDTVATELLSTVLA